MNHHHTPDDAERRDVDDALTIRDRFDGEGFGFDVVRADLDGRHPTVRNDASDRAYYVLSGEGTVRVGDDEYDVEAGDLVTIPAGTPHGTSGEMSYLVVTAPPFDPANETVVE